MIPLQRQLQLELFNRIMHRPYRPQQIFAAGRVIKIVWMSIWDFAAVGALMAVG